MLLRKSRKTECGAKWFLSRAMVRRTLRAWRNLGAAIGMQRLWQRVTLRRLILLDEDSRGNNCTPTYVFTWYGRCAEGRREVPVIFNTSNTSSSRKSPAANLDRSVLVDLMVRYQAADLSAAEELVQRLSPLLLRFFSGPYYTRCHNEDLLQDCWLQIHLARHTFRPALPLMPWIFAIAKHVRCKEYHRQLRIRSREFGVDALPEAAKAPWPVTHSREQDFLWALDVLPESQREVLFLLKVSGMSTEEVAKITSCSVGAVKQKAHRAYETLRKLYLRQGQEKN
ncbi:MAG: RNA polymerase sigma factor [Bryobacteraceae bacterium]